MINTSFLTLPDPRVKPSGSRDPLGFQTIWVKLGREIVGDNLTTITSSIDNFIITLLACHYAFKEKNESKKMDVFFKVEQLGAYFRIAAKHKNNIMGITRAEKNYNLETTSKIEIGSNAQIFGNQKTSGLWGYYSSALMMSKLINKDKNEITALGEEVINKFLQNFSLDNYINESYIPKDTILKNSSLFIKALNVVYKDMSNIVLNKSDYQIYTYASEFFTQTKETNYKDFFRWLNKEKKDERLTHKLNEIKSIDKSLMVASKVFEFCRKQKDKTIEDVAVLIQESDFGKLTLESSVDKINDFIDNWNNRNFEEAIKDIIEVHVNSMENRSSGTWISIKNDQTLKIVISSKMNLPEVKEEMPWQYNYFLHSYISISKQVFKEGENSE